MARRILVLLGFCLAWSVFLIPGSSWAGVPERMLIVERESGSVVVVDAATHTFLARVEGLGLMHHAGVSFSRDSRYAFVVTRDGWLNQVALDQPRLKKRVRVGESSIGLAVTMDNRWVAVSNYVPPEVRILDVATLSEQKVIPAVREYPDGRRVLSKTVGLVDAPGNRFVFGLMDADGIWVVDTGKPGFPVVRRVWDAGEMPYDGLLTPDGRYYLAGFFKSDWMGVLDTADWKSPVRKVSLKEPGRTYGKHPVLKVPHLEGWAQAGDMLFLPVVGERRLAVFDRGDWSFVASIPLAGTPVFAMARPDGRQVWVNFSGKENNQVQVVDTATRRVIKTLEPGRRVFHLAFTPNGAAVYVSANQDDRVVVYDTERFEVISILPVHRPSGIFSTDRARRMGL